MKSAADTTSRFAPAAVSILALAISAWGIGRPSFWYDEAATISAINRPWHDMVAMLGNVDAVHGAYYFVMYGWLQITGDFGLSEFGSRLPSALAIAAAAGLIVVLGTKLVDRRFGVVAGLVLATLPRVLWTASEARGYAFTVMLAVASTLLALIAAERGKWWWAAYVATSVVLVVFFVPAITVVGVNVLIVVLRNGFAPIAELLISSIAVGLINAPFAAFAQSQTEQISWMAPVTRQTLVDAVLLQYTEESPAYLILGIVVVLAALTAALWRSVPKPVWHAAVAGALLAAIPTMVTLVYSAFVTPTYVPRYMSFTAPGVALVLAAAIRALARHRDWVAAVLVAALALAAVPAFLAQRGPYGRAGGSDFSQVADFVGSHARAGDCVAFEPVLSWSPTSQRIVMRAKPVQFRGLRDIGPSVDAVAGDKLWDDPRPVGDYTEWASDCSVVWAVTDRERTVRSSVRPCGCIPWFFDPFHFENSPLYRALQASGLSVDSRTQFNDSQVVRMARSR
ncbi:glycosyltransferase family 39 protein [Smaragdicoccus niigatensis]|uniref:glycosyltransferase family 39 protein n=1 Tax=Smaragdicoccus niigatensis TaxID=359359 RepID=UPI00035C457A|nr:glycosyltransferase family 39 protein [Smaragdicoccus niigatensis]